MKRTQNRTPALCQLLEKVFERHGRGGDNNIQNVKPWGGHTFREGLTEYKIIKRGVPIKISMLWYERDLGTGHNTSQAVRIREVIR